MTTEDALRERVADLEEENRQLRTELNGEVDLEKKAVLRRAFRLTPTEADIVLMLYRRHMPVARETIIHRLNLGNRGGPACENASSVHISHIRTKFEIATKRRGHILTHYIAGYELSEVGRKAVGEALGA